MTDLTPPPEQPMDDQTRARIRSRLAETTSTEPSTRHRWMMPIVAAAAVLVIAFGGAYFAFCPGNEGASPAPGTQESTPPVVETSAVPSELASEAPSLRASDPPTSQPPGGPGYFEFQETTCRDEVAQELRGADQVVSWPLPDGEVGIWVAGDRAALCEDSGGTATVHQPRPFPATYPMARETLHWSTVSYMVGETSRSAYVAGGSLPDGVTGITYLWPGNDAEEAQIATDAAGNRWWSVGHVPTDGPMVRRGGSLMDLDPVEVTISLSGTQDHVTLPWGVLNECAQVNHGC